MPRVPLRMLPLPTPAGSRFPVAQGARSSPHAERTTSTVFVSWFSRPSGLVSASPRSLASQTQLDRNLLLSRRRRPLLLRHVIECRRHHTPTLPAEQPLGASGRKRHIRDSPGVGPGYFDGSWTKKSWTDQGIRDKIGAWHLPMAGLLQAVLDAGLMLEQVVEGGPVTPMTLAFRARRSN